MAAWILVPCLQVLRAEFNALNPARDRASDGSVGDLAHQDSSSDHNPDESGETPYNDADSTNEVHAIDIDKTGPWPAGYDFESRVETVRWRHYNGQDARLQNIIWRGRIASRTWGWTWRTYTGANKHNEHAHFSARYTASAESDVRSWGVADWSFMATEAQVRNVVRQELAAFAAALSPGDNNVWDDMFGRTERQSAGAILVETRDNVRAIKAAVVPPAETPTDPPA